MGEFLSRLFSPSTSYLFWWPIQTEVLQNESFKFSSGFDTSVSSPCCTSLLVFKRRYMLRTKWWRIPFKETSYDRFVTINARSYGRNTLSFFPQSHDTRQVRNREKHTGIYEEVEGKSYFFILSDYVLRGKSMSLRLSLEFTFYYLT
jgi:hypothetical protein